MNTMPMFFSFAFFTIFAIYFFFGTYILSLNSKSVLNRVFFVLCLSLSLWAFSFATANSAPDYTTALFWRRVAALGWGTVYSFLLHFILILTEQATVLKKKWIGLLLYLPAAVNVVAFSLHTRLAPGLYSLQYTSAGWVNISLNGVYDWIFNVHYLGFTIAGVVLAWQWGRTAVETNKKQQARLLVSSLALALVVGTLTDIYVNTYTSLTLPQLGPIVILIPVSAIFYAIKRHGLMVPTVRKQAPESGRILSEASRSRVYKYLTMSYVLGSFLHIVAHNFVVRAALIPVLIFSGALFVIGMIIHTVQQLEMKENYQDAISFFLVAVSIPFFSLSFLEKAGITVWAAPSIFVILSVVISKRQTFAFLSTSIILTLLIVWMKAPTATVQVGAADHLARVGIFSVMLWLAYYVNRLYLKRLEENEDQIKYQKLISQLSANFVNVKGSNLDEKIKQMLQCAGEYFHVDRAYFFIFSEDQKVMRYTHEWCAAGIEPATGIVREVPTDTCPWWMEQIFNKGIVHIPRVALLPPEASEEKELLTIQGVQSLISVPVVTKDGVLGFLGFDAMKTIKVWQDEHQELLRVLANLLADAYSKITAENEINYMAYYDDLTGLPNRTLFKNRLNQAIHLATRSEKLIGVLFIDLDSFKSVNDTMGHGGGDAMLKIVAEKLCSRVRKYDTVSRFGGDEFLIMLPQMSDLKDIRKVADSILACFAEPLLVYDQEFFITASIGIAVFPADGEEAETLIENADLAMYSSKEQGKNRYSLCSSDLKEDVLINMRLTNSLYRAQERNELVLYYQPQVCAVTKQIIGLEALIRWKHPNLGMVSPVTFIPLAEQTGLINPIGQWVLRTACQQNKVWQDMGLPPIRMAVNLSVEQFRDPNLVGMVDQALADTGLQPEYLEIEITESTAIKEADYIIQILEGFKRLGVTIAIDDFGTEFSSLSRLKTLPIDRIKMAMQFVRGISTNHKDEAIAKVIISLAKNLGLKVIAEGVETQAQLEFLTAEMCDEIQGYYYYRPMPAEDIEAVLRGYRV